MKNCDMCGSKIIDNKCSCGVWVDICDQDVFKLSFDKFHDMKQFTLIMDAPYLGAAAVYFRGYFKDTQKVKEFILKFKKREFYEN